ncbi:MAG TPA: hypothetical protein VKE40_11095 [Gemmataceae bacterium]|nr:hypothetical protein [Gemmataceae bacterium]
MNLAIRGTDSFANDQTPCSLDPTVAALAALLNAMTGEERAAQDLRCE